MASINISKQTTLYTVGQAVSCLHLIISGSVKIKCSKISYILGKGDVIGIIESSSEKHFCSCIAIEDCVLLPLPLSWKKGIVPLTSGNRDMTNLFSISLFRQILFFFDAYRHACSHNRRSRKFIKQAYEYYQEFCTRHSFAPHRLDIEALISELNFTRPIEPWEYSYYKGLYDIFSHQVTEVMVTNPDVLNGFARKAFFDVRRLVTCCDEIAESDIGLSAIYLNEDKKDLLEYFSSLLYLTPGDDPEYKTLEAYKHKILQIMEKHPGLNNTYLSLREKEFQEKLANHAASGGAGSLAKLHNSALAILEYAGCDKTIRSAFLDALNAYKALKDKSSTDDDARVIRRDMTKYFYEVYTAAFFKSINDYALPPAVRMFFDFGYVDEELAGEENAAYLYTLSEHLPTNPKNGIYSMYEWLHAVYLEEKAPSRNEFDQDYPTYLRTERTQGNITIAQEEAALHDPEQMVRFELSNLFPSVNKITCGRVTTFCPVFCGEHAIKPLPECLVTEESIHQSMDLIRAVDFRAYYRDTMFSDPALGTAREYVMVEVLPDFILTPNVGSRPVMWQEIEGKKRTTPARMCLSLFNLESLKMQLTRLTGEFRWEMCRRIQGPRWNDLSEPSLTSEYFDYVQFYRKNHDLSTEAKEKLKNSLQKARNSYKELFVQDYMLWVLFESNGSPRLNKVARSILFTYCPFARSYRETLRSNPIYTEIFDKYNIKLSAQIHKLENVFTKFPDGVPEELQRQMEYLKM